MTLCLNQDILFDIGKQLIEDSDPKAAIRFAFSGKESFKAMKKVFASVTTFKLYKDHFTIGWDNKCSKFEFQDGKIHPHVLFDLIGNCVTKLHLDIFWSKFPISHPSYIPCFSIIERIVAKKQLISFSAGFLRKTSFMDEFLPQFAATLKNITIPDNLMTPTFRDSFKLDSLIVLGKDGYNFHNSCCKTTSLEFSCYSENVWMPLRVFPVNINADYVTTAVENLIVNTEYPAELYDELGFTYPMDDMMRIFPSLDCLKLNTIVQNIPNIRERLLSCVFGFIKIIVIATTKVPPKITYTISGYNKYVSFIILDRCKMLSAGFEFDETISDFYCFRKTLQTAAKHSTIFEVKFSK